MSTDGKMALITPALHATNNFSRNYIFFAKYNKKHQTKYASIQGPGMPLTPKKVGKAFNDYVDSVTKKLKRLNRLGSPDKKKKGRGEPRIQLTRR